MRRTHTIPSAQDIEQQYSISQGSTLYTTTRGLIDREDAYFSPRQRPRISSEDAIARLKARGLDLSGRVIKRVTHASTGGFCVVHQGTMGQRVVAIREYYLRADNRQDVAKTVALELRIWSGLHHINILPLLGYTMDFGPYPACISPWMENGTVMQYLERNPAADRCTIIIGVAFGLGYLHEKQVVHSDLKGANVLITENGTPVLADFGLSRLLKVSHVIKTTKEVGGSFQWMAVELFDETLDDIKEAPPGVPTKSSDVWAFGVTVMEILTGLVPFADLKNWGLIVTAVVLYERHPYERPHFWRKRSSEYALWDLALACINRRPSMRPTMYAVLQSLSVIVPDSTTLEPLHVASSPNPTHLERHSSNTFTYQSNYSTENLNLTEGSQSTSHRHFSRSRSRARVIEFQYDLPSQAEDWDTIDALASSSMIGPRELPPEWLRSSPSQSNISTASTTLEVTWSQSHTDPRLLGGNLMQEHLKDVRPEENMHPAYDLYPEYETTPGLIPSMMWTGNMTSTPFSPPPSKSDLNTINCVQSERPIDTRTHYAEYPALYPAYDTSSYSGSTSEYLFSDYKE